MAIISFSKTVEEFMSGKKTCTRRDWSDRQFNIWCNFWYNGKVIHDAYDKSPRSGGKKIGQIELMGCPYRERLLYMPILDLEAEGGMCKTVDEFCKFIGKTKDDIVTVIRFRRV